MASVKVNFSGLKNLKNYLNKKDLEEIGEQVLKDVKKNISRGISPVKGEPAKFASYARDRSGAVSKYPSRRLQSKYGKRTKPVNLKLKGGYIDAIKTRVKSKNIEIYFKPFNKKIEDLFKAHNLGLNKKKKVPKRKHLPSERNDRFTTAIELKMLDLLNKAMKNAIKRVNK